MTIFHHIFHPCQHLLSPNHWNLLTVNKIPILSSGFRTFDFHLVPSMRMEHAIIDRDYDNGSFQYGFEENARKIILSIFICANFGLGLIFGFEMVS